MADNKKVMTMKEINDIQNMNISDFITMKVKEGWESQSRFFTKSGVVCIYKDSRDIKYTIEYEYDDNNVLIPKKLLRICGVTIDLA